MNPIVDKMPASIATIYGTNVGRRPRAFLIATAIPVYSILMYGMPVDGGGGAFALFLAAVTYLLAIYLYYGIAQLALARRTHLLWGSGAAAIVVGHLFSGLSNFWPLFMGLAMIFSAGIICGRLTAAGWPPRRVYITGIAAVVVFFSAHFLPLWTELMNATANITEQAMTDLEKMLLSAGYSQQVVRDSMGRMQTVFNALVRLVPAFTIMSALLQFSVGYLLFAHLANRGNPSLGCGVQIVKWKVPFAVTPFLIVTILLRVLGNETMTVVADNVLVCLSVYYCIAGLSLVEYYFRILRLSMLLKTVFYILLLLAQLPGFFVAGLLGFVDSFVDWRKEPSMKTV